jgi:hypothetical protein
MKFANVTIVSKFCTTYDDRCVCVKSYCLLNPSRRTTSTEYYNLWRLHLPFGFFFRIVVEILRRGSTHNVFAGSVILYECCWFSDSLWMMLGQWFSMNVAGSVILYECCWVSDSLWMLLGQWFSMNDAGSVIPYECCWFSDTMYDSGQDIPSNYHRLLKNNKYDI